ncbi:M81 family metallopeptidase [Ramlibacter tataouinensis]|uniref:M81 family metallopeptidase n=1 Tax=Ramlibacter tataouinensis TaxID=94132 RepID=UPI0022F3FD5A|nr:M81 family metallopeptidase [Ramlibacter tataouinensis]WBY03563.1 M81 family metallopeptidase [Ramlibacter tataouinensis]
MRVFSGGLATETNTFAPMPTGMASFKDRGYFAAGQHPDHMFFFAGPLWAARLRGKEFGWDLVEGMVAGAQPSGITTRATYEALRDELLADLKRALPVDMVLLGLHGAMVADGYDDCEGDLLRRVREIVGPNVVVGAELDPHSHLSAAMVDNADVLVAFKEYPHTDVLERALELVDLCAAKVRGERQPVAAMVDCDMIVTMHTSRDPARAFVDRIQALEGQDGILSISIAHGFAWGDVPDMGTKVLVYADGDAGKAQRLARQLADELIAMREALTVRYPSIDEALDEALAFDGGPVIISDGADNPGGGAASDATFILQRILERGVANVAIGPFWDPVAARIAVEAGEGAQLDLRIGGKVSPLSGPPLDLPCTVKAVRHEHMQTGLSNTPTAMGDCALVECRGVEILLVSIRNQAMGSDLFTGIGCDLAARKVVVVKSSQHFYASYSKIGRHVIYAGAPGAVTLDLKMLPYRKIRRPKWPLDA